MLVKDNINILNNNYVIFNINHIIFIYKVPVEIVDQSLFVDILALCALDLTFRDPEPSDLEKVFILFNFLSIFLKYYKKN